MSAVVEVVKLLVQIQGVTVLQNINFKLEKSEMLAVVGPNGAGKSSLLKALLNTEVNVIGDVRFWGQSLDLVRKKIAWVPQSHDVDWEFPLTVGDVVMQGRFPHLGLFRSPSIRDIKKVEEALRRTEIWDLRARPMHQLSGGQKQRMFLARALAQEAELFLLDEPTSGLDSKNEDLLFKQVKELVSEGKTFVVVHHNLFSVKKHFPKTLLLNVTSFGFGASEEILTPSKIEKAYNGVVE